MVNHPNFLKCNQKYTQKAWKFLAKSGKLRLPPFDNFLITVTVIAEGYYRMQNCYRRVAYEICHLRNWKENRSQSLRPKSCNLSLLRGRANIAK